MATLRNRFGTTPILGEQEQRYMDERMRLLGFQISQAVCAAKLEAFVDALAIVHTSNGSTEASVGTLQQRIAKLRLEFERGVK